MRLQGMPWHLLKDLELTFEQGMTVAGNAYSGFVVSPVLTASWMHVPWEEVAAAIVDRAAAHVDDDASPMAHGLTATALQLHNAGTAHDEVGDDSGDDDQEEEVEEEASSRDPTMDASADERPDDELGGLLM